MENNTYRQLLEALIDMGSEDCDHARNALCDGEALEKLGNPDQSIVEDLYYDLQYNQDVLKHFFK